MDRRRRKGPGGHGLAGEPAAGGRTAGDAAAGVGAGGGDAPGGVGPESGSAGATGLDTVAVIVAAGASSRMGGKVRKPFMKIGGREALAWAIGTLARVSYVRRFVIVTRPEDRAAARRTVRRMSAAIAGREVRFADGGALRRDSVINGLEACGEDLPIVAVHDAARPLASPERIELAIETAARAGGAILACPIRDTVKLVDPGGRVVKTIPRDGLYAAQTPQVFRLSLIRRLAERARREGLETTDDAAILEVYGEKPLVVESGPENLKITTPEDLRIAEALLMFRAGRSGAGAGRGADARGSLAGGGAGRARRKETGWGVVRRRGGI
ncbi:MAG: 2-C-methyl-D-erythritol 4-phosphate cytidylyltransferase [Planctomycetota bacterium]|nr:2-C-methyl-D-erythritol 4-phosphate cytidylyltransferase [Planctomycetota bacterium]